MKKAGEAVVHDKNLDPVLQEVGGWEGVSLVEGTRGERSARLGRVEIGHMHGSRVAHFGFPKELWRELIFEGIVHPHPMQMEGWAERRIRNEEDRREVIDLFRLNYERLLAGRPGMKKGKGNEVDE